MPITLKEIEAVDNGAHFFNADLHVHSYGGSHDISDTTMTVQAIIDAAIKQEIAVLSITDHNTDKNLSAALEYAQSLSGQILLIPGVEITTAHGHLLVYFAPEEVTKIRDLLARINLVGKPGERDTHTTRSMADVIKEVETLGGISVAAHIDLEKTGFEMLAAGYPNWKKDILASSGLYGLEFVDAANLSWYSQDDDSSPQGMERRKLYEGRSIAPATQGHPKLAHVQGSDAHSLRSFIERNSRRPRTRLKMDEGSFASFKTAFTDPDARVRATATIPDAIPRVRGLHITGGFLDGQVFQFSDNLNCFIGGRGTGKSTAIRSLAYGLGVSDDLEEYENCPASVVVYAEDANGILYRYERRHGASIAVKAKDDESIQDVPSDAFRVEFYGQGDLAKVAEDPLKNPTLLQEFLDRHITLRDLREKEESLIGRLTENSAQLVPIEARFAQLAATQLTVKELDKKLKIAEDGKVKEIAASQTRLSAEESLAEALEGVREFYESGLSLSNFERNYDEILVASGTTTGDAKSNVILAAIRKVIADTNALLTSKEKEVNVALKASAADIAGKLRGLRQNDVRLEEALAEKISELQKKGLTGSLNELQAIVTQRANATRIVTGTTAQRPQLDSLKTARAKYLIELGEARAEISARRNAQLQNINKHLKRTLLDYIVFIQYQPQGVTDEFKELLLDGMQGSHFSEQAALRFAGSTTPAEFAALLQGKDFSGIAKIAAIGMDWARELQSEFGNLTMIHRLEALWKPPCPVITVKTKGLPARDIPVNQLSDGQKHTILLTVAMFAESNLPLIIDQPEDDLDNAFIFSSVVTTLKEIKERRQVILVTHNANIAVLGDAELLAPMKRSGDRGIVFERGSIDRAETKAAVRDILEGGDVAFLRRKAIYGF